MVGHFAVGDVPAVIYHNGLEIIFADGSDSKKDYASKILIADSHVDIEALLPDGRKVTNHSRLHSENRIIGSRVQDDFLVIGMLNTGEYWLFKTLKMFERFARRTKQVAAGDCVALAARY